MIYCSFLLDRPLYRTIFYCSVCDINNKLENVDIDNDAEMDLLYHDVFTLFSKVEYYKDLAQSNLTRELQYLIQHWQLKYNLKIFTTNSMHLR